MDTVIGLFSSDEDVKHSVAKLKEGGFGEDEIMVFTCRDEVCQCLNKYSSYHLVGVWTLFGLFFGMVLLGSLGLIASLVNFRILGYSMPLWGNVFLGLGLVGAVVGALIGYIFGNDQWQRETRLYHEGAQAGDKIVAVRVTDGETAVKAEVLLQHEAAKGIERLGHVPEDTFKQMADHRSPEPAVPRHA
ncbi:MAG TPA: hypothetical protein PKE64_11230 [Anaerolineae bacterium]|nr:hypothetical protein [Anaerolineae bacterium]HMR64571.1 hypothetical protein [Anaerolineae bacterium]